MKNTMELQGKVYDDGATTALRCGININTVTVWTKRGLLPPPIKIGCRKFYQRDLVEACLAKGE
jgi:hypothetical protein